MASFIASVRWANVTTTDGTTINVSADNSDEAMDIAHEWVKRRGFVNIIAISVKEV